MLGMPSPVEKPSEQPAPPASESAAAPPAEGRVPSPTTNRTMLGMNAPARDAAPAVPSGPPRARASVQYGGGDTSDEFDSATYRPPGKGPSLVTVLAVLAILGVFLLVAALGAWWFLAGGSNVRAEVGHEGGEEVLRVEVPEAEAGTKVRFRGEERPLEGGMATLPLPEDALSVGENELVVGVVSPDGDVSEETVTLELRYRVRADLDALAEDPPALAIVAEVPEGASVSLDGAPVTLEGGRAEARYELPESEPDARVYERDVPYRISLPGGETVEGEVQTRIPYASLQIDRPGAQVVTDAETIEVAGAVAEDGSVTVDGEAVEVNEGRFVHRLALPEPDTYRPRVVARQPGRAPRVRTLEVRRVEDLEAEAASFEPDPGMGYARIAQNPSVYRGQKIALEGRVYNVSVSRGRSDIQMLAEDCPRGERCPVWVRHTAATDVSAGDWVRVLGEIGGEQQFRSETNRVITVPRIDAAFVLPRER